MKFSAALILASLLAACGTSPSDETRVRELVASAESAAEARDTSDVLTLVADDYADAQGLDKKALANFLRGFFLTHPKLELLVHVDEVTLPVAGLAQVRLTVSSVGTDGFERAPFELELRKIGGEWRVTRADRLQPDGT